MKIEVHLFGKLREFAADSRITSNSVVEMNIDEGDTIEMVVRRLGIDMKDTSHLFLNAEYSAPDRPVRDGDRLGVFPDNMSLLYRQYFVKRRERED